MIRVNLYKKFQNSKGQHKNQIVISITLTIRPLGHPTHLTLIGQAVQFIFLRPPFCCSICKMAAAIATLTTVSAKNQLLIYK